MRTRARHLSCGASALAKSSLLELARQQLRFAGQAEHGCSWRTVWDEDSGAVRHVVVALRAGRRLGPDVCDLDASWTAQVLQGGVVLSTALRRSFGWPGDLVIAPRAHCELAAVADSALLITTTGQVGRGA